MRLPFLPAAALASALFAPLAMAADTPLELKTDVTLLTGKLRPFPDPENLPARAALPDPLVTFLGAPVKTPEQWVNERAPELRRLFQYYMYGQMPEDAGIVGAKVLREDRAALGGKATLREIDVRLPKREASVHLLVVLPNERKGPAPVFLGINFNGNHALLDDPQIQLPKSWMPSGRLGVGEDHKASEAGRGKEKEMWAIEQTIDRGYALACFYHGDVEPDNAAQVQKLVRQPEASASATIARWAWGFSRMIDYLVTDKDLDPKRIAVVGHSRNGKTALLAAAMDERIALAIPSQAGCGGTAPSRVAPEFAAPKNNGRPTAETVAVINKNFPHWFCGNFKAFNEAVEKLPFDQHCLLALCAPRPVLVSNATEDLWANPAGQFEMLRAANPVYMLVAGDGLGAEAMPEVGTLLASRLGYFIRAGKHSMTTPDWKVWLDYADKWLKPGAVAACCEQAKPAVSRTALLTGSAGK